MKRGFCARSSRRLPMRPRNPPVAGRTELERPLAEHPDHLSLYQLTIEADTPFATLHAAGKLRIPDADAARALYDVTQEVTAARGLPAYEVSNHARPGAECRHNLIYLRYGEYARVGPGAHGRIEADGARVATATEKHPERWLLQVESRGHGLIVDETLSREEQADELLLMGLRLTEGIDPARFAATAGRPLDRSRIADLCAQHLIEIDGLGRLRVAPAGFPRVTAVVADPAACPEPAKVWSLSRPAVAGARGRTG